MAIGWLDQQFLADRIGKQLVSGGDVEIALRIASRYELWYNSACQLRHQIPAWRTTQSYLIKINYGLGSSKLLGDAMLWSESYETWILASVKQALQHSLGVCIQALRVPLKRQSLAAVVITFHFWRGYWAGIWHFSRIDTQKRQQLLGCAKLIARNSMPFTLSKFGA
jgi:hypothetical protein